MHLLREQRTVLENNHRNVTRTTCQVAHIFPRGTVRRPFFAVVEHRIRYPANSTVAAGYSTLDTQIYFKLFEDSNV